MVLKTLVRLQRATERVVGGGRRRHGRPRRRHLGKRRRRRPCTRPCARPSRQSVSQGGGGGSGGTAAAAACRKRLGYNGRLLRTHDVRGGRCSAAAVIPVRGRHSLPVHNAAATTAAGAVAATCARTALVHRHGRRHRRRRTHAAHRARRRRLSRRRRRRCRKCRPAAAAAGAPLLLLLRRWPPGRHHRAFPPVLLAATPEAAAWDTTATAAQRRCCPWPRRHCYCHGCRGSGPARRARSLERLNDQAPPGMPRRLPLMFRAASPLGQRLRVFDLAGELHMQSALACHVNAVCQAEWFLHTDFSVLGCEQETGGVRAVHVVYAQAHVVVHHAMSQRLTQVFPLGAVLAHHVQHLQHTRLERPICASKLHQPLQLLHRGDAVKRHAWQVCLNVGQPPRDGRSNVTQLGHFFAKVHVCGLVVVVEGAQRLHSEFRRHGR
mmetsp:Transcript_14278/g.41639  ORF Transcript_14278/g.41639 Transcript_14278/m.41639 type:complete len:437 (-) Transcript_14278:1397-2707(-)